MEASVNQPPPKNGPQQNQKRNARVSIELHADTTFNKIYTTKNNTINTLILPHVYDADRSWRKHEISFWYFFLLMMLYWLLWCLMESQAAAVLGRWTWCQPLCSQAWLCLQSGLWRPHWVVWASHMWPVLTVVVHRNFSAQFFFFCKVQFVGFTMQTFLQSSELFSLSLRFDVEHYVWCGLGSLNQYLLAGCSLFTSECCQNQKGLMFSRDSLKMFVLKAVLCIVT